MKPRARRVALFVAILGIAAIIEGCAPQYNTIWEEDRIAPQTTTVIPEQVPSVLVNRITIGVPAGKRIGSYYDGLAKVRQGDYFWGSNLFIDANDLLEVSNEYLKAKGFPAPSKNLPSTGFFLTGSVIDIAFNYYGKILAGNYSEALVRVRWTLQDGFSGSAVFTGTSKGYGRANGLSKKAIFNAFKSAIDRLIVQPAFLSVLRQKSPDLEPTPSSSTATQEQIKLRSCTRTEALEIPRDIEALFPGVVVVKSYRGLGSGVIISPAGWLLTAAHVIKGVEVAKVTFASGVEINASVVKVNDKFDVALLKVPGENYPCIPIASQKSPIGSPLYAIGAPLSEALSYTVTKGIVSAYRTTKTHSLIQSDTPVNPGNSGGPLLNNKGEVVGIVSAKIAGPAVEGIAFAVPAQEALAALNVTFVKEIP